MRSGYDIAQERYSAIYDGIKRLTGDVLERVITSPQGAEVVINGNKVLNFSTNDYLGMCNNEAVKEGAIEAIKSHGFGAGSVRLMSGTQDLHKKLEKELADFLGTEDCVLFSSCYDANGAVFDVLLTDKDAVLSDELNHASLIDGIRLCKAKRLRYKHLNMEDLEKGLIEAKDCPIKLIATDAAFSMDGDVAPLPEIVALAKKYSAMILIDESHSTGVFGKHGKGTIEYFNVMGQIDIITSTLGKALGGGTGGFICAKKLIVDLIRMKGRPYIFSNAIAPPIIGGTLAALKNVKEHPECVAKVQANTAYFRKRMLEVTGFKVSGNADSAICPAILKDERLAFAMGAELLKHGIHVMPVCYPVVPKGLARLRITMTAAHTTEHLDKFIAAFKEIMESKKEEFKAIAAK